MTRDEWKIEWREIRLRRPKSAATVATMTELLREVYTYLYTDQESAFCRLVDRYRPTLGTSKDDQYFQFKASAKQRGGEWMKNLVFAPNPFLTMLGKP